MEDSNTKIRLYRQDIRMKSLYRQMFYVNYNNWEKRKNGKNRTTNSRIYQNACTEGKL